MQSPFLSQKHWPASHVPETVFQHFLNTRYYPHDRNHLYLYLRKNILDALKSNEEFSQFWTDIQEQHPLKKNYFSSLLNREEPYDPHWIDCQYKKYQQQKAFESLSEEERREIQNKFDEIKPAAYQAALGGESKRLKCDITDVTPTNPVLPWEPAHDEESMLARLPAELFAKTFQFLESLDIFTMTLVCKSWKRLVYDNSLKLKRAEHSVTTHLIRFTAWMDPGKTPPIQTFMHQYQIFSWSLTRWYCGVGENLETLILEHPILYSYLADLLQSCPNLKHLRIGYDDDYDISPIATSPPRVQLPNLELFISSSSLDHWIADTKPCQQLYRDILVSSQSLRVYKGYLNTEDLLAIVPRNLVSNVFNKLIALDLENFTASVLEMLAQIDNMQLKYLSLDYCIGGYEVDQRHYKVRLTNALHQLLPKLSKLEMLRTSFFLGVTNKTIQLITKLKLNLKWAVLYCSYFQNRYGDDWNASAGEDSLQPEALDSFQNMLLSRHPDIDLSEIRLIIRQTEIREAIEAMNIGFTILKADLPYGYPNKLVNELYNPKIKQWLGIDF